MDEVIVRVLRTVARLARLRILSRLLSCTELTPSQLARQMRLSRDPVSAHLARLASAALVQRRRSGARCFCRAGSPYRDGTLSGDIAAWLRQALASDAAKAASAPAVGSRDSAVSESQRAVFEAATAFTSPRRVQVLRRLERGGGADGVTLIRELHMSGTALSRHLNKLARRGYVLAKPAGRNIVYALAPTAKTPHHSRLLEIIRSHWGARQLRS